MTLHNVIKVCDLSIAQSAMWFIHECYPDIGVYNVEYSWEIPDDIDLDTLQNAIDLLADRHEFLRSTYFVDAGVPKRKVWNYWYIQMERYSVGAINTQKLSQEYIELEVRKPFDLTKAPPKRYILYERKGLKPVFSIIMNHIIMDLATTMMWANELRVVYESLLRGVKPQLVALNYCYEDFVQEQEAYMGSPACQRDELFWLDALGGKLAPLNLPIDKMRPAKNECYAGYLTGKVNEDIVKNALELAGAYQFTPYEIFLAFYILFLHKYTRQNEICIGTPTAGRHEKYMGVYGYFVNPIVLRVEVNSEESTINQLAAIVNTVRNALEHRYYPAPILAKKLALDRSDGGGSLFQTSFVWQNANSFFNRDESIVSWNSDGRRFWDMKKLGVWERIPRHQQIDDQDLTFKIYKLKDGYHWGLEYNPALFNRESVEDVIGFFENILKQASANPEVPVKALSLLDDRRTQLLLQHGVGQKLDINQNDYFVARFESVVGQYPDCNAVVYDSHKITYKALNARANKLAHYLISQGAQPNQLVGISVKRSIDLIACVLGVLKSGAAYLPLDPGYPSERLSYIVEDSNVVGLVADNEAVLDLCRAKNCYVLDIESKDTLDRYPDSNPEIVKQPTDLSYVIYTSGSTGKPKGVEISEHGLASLIVAQREVFRLGVYDNVLQFASINFDASVFEIAIALSSGATLYMAQKETLLGSSLVSFISTHAISFAVLPPAVLATMESQNKLQSLKTLLTAGDACSQELVNQWADGRNFYNAYGPTEATVWSTVALLGEKDSVTIGQAIPNTQTYILDESFRPVPVGIPGELFIGGEGLARGYLNKPELTAERFLELPQKDDGLKRIYRTGDVARYLSDGNIEFLGRIDHQVKVRGYRIELEEIRAQLLIHPSIHDALVLARTDMPGATVQAPILVGYVVKNSSENLSIEQVQSHLRLYLPEYMVPSHYAILDAFPLTPNEKIDRKALPVPKTSDVKKQLREPRNEIERILLKIWESSLGLKNISITENFFDLGGHSLLVAKVYSLLPSNLQEKATLVDLFKYPTIQSLAHFLEKDIEEDEFYLSQDDHAERLRLRRRLMESLSGVKVAIVGMAGRFPGAENVRQFWQNLCEGKESIKFFTAEELRRAGVPEETIHQSNYVPAKGMLDSISGFDSDFFNFTPREALITDPQQRLFLECSWEALEDAGCVPENFGGRIGVYAGIGMNQYLMTHLSAHQDFLAEIGDYPLMIGNDKDFLSTRVSYKLNLNGPAMVLQTACSTSLVAVHTACQALLNEECDAALAGGVSFNRLGKTGYFYHEGMIMSPDGHCRAFDENAQGTVQGQGCGVVMLKRLDDALQNNDHIYAVIVGSATNNDGSNKSGYTAPSIEGQAKVINTALATANLDPAKISFVETHGTGTPVGDPIEVEALRQVFQKDNAPQNTCALGAVKTNIGHLDAASGVTGLIKAAKSIEARMLVPTLHYKKPNPRIDFSKTPFYVNTELSAWQPKDHVCFAGVSSFGIGGTNAHVVISEAPHETQVDSARPWRLVTLSARSPQALERMTERFVEHLKTNKRHSFSNMCYTLHVGRKLFDYRRHLVCRNRDEAIAELTSLNPQHVKTHHYSDHPKKLVFMFSGQGSQYVGMGKHLYQVELTFREEVNACRELIKQKFVHLYEELSEADNSAQTEKIHETYVTQPGLFIFEYALAKTLMYWGIEPDSMIGHSVGEYVAACLAGVFTLEQALELVTIRGNLIQDLEGGDMLSVKLEQEQAARYVNDSVSLAVVNSKNRCVLSGNSNAIRELHTELEAEGVESRILHTSHAFHSYMMEPILERFKAYVERRMPQKPKRPYVSSFTGDWISDEQATSPQYWADHLRHTVQFYDGLNTILTDRSSDDSKGRKEQFILLEVGPGNVLKNLASQHPAKQPQDLALAATRHAYESISDTQYLMGVIGTLWERGVNIDWEAFHSARQRYRVPLPTYPFERKTYWVKPGEPPLLHQNADRSLSNEDGAQEAQSVPDIEMPSDFIEQTLWNLWQASLGIDRFGIFDNFFDLGGDSLVAVSVIDRIKKIFRIPLASHVLINRPSIAELSEYIQLIGSDIENQSNDAPPHTALVKIQEGEDEQLPLIMIHPIGGEVFFYRDLAHYLGSEQSVYAFQAPSLSGISEPIDSVPAIAERYLAELDQAGISGPYLLGGSSFGGLVAYEMAQQINRREGVVKLLVMIDTPAPWDMPEHLTESAAILEYLLDELLDLDGNKLRMLDEKNQIEYVLEQARAQGKGGMLPPHLGVPLFKTWQAHQIATANYRPQPIHNNVLYFRHSEPKRDFPGQPHLPWRDLVLGEFSVHQVPGDHVSMNYPPHVKTLAKHLKEQLRSINMVEELL